jgi:hypothetical protein
VNYYDIIETALPGAHIEWETTDGRETGSVSGYPTERDDQTLIPVCTLDHFILLIDTNQIIRVTPHQH